MHNVYDKLKDYVREHDILLYWLGTFFYDDASSIENWPHHLVMKSYDEKSLCF